MAARASTQMTIPCTQCGTEFQLMRAEHEKKLRKGQTNRFCSSECLHRSLSTRASGRSCPQCGQRIEQDNGRKYCTRACGQAARDAAAPKMTCPTCGTSFRPKNSRRVYCSIPCKDSGHSVNQIGPSNSHFKDGTSYAEWFKRMRPLIIERDVCCRGCGEIPEPLHYVWRGKPATRSRLVVHHIDEDPRHNWPENLILLCSPCHVTHHRSRTTPFGWFGEYAEQASRSMTSKWKATATSLQEKYSYTTA